MIINKHIANFLGKHLRGTSGYFIYVLILWTIYSSIFFLIFQIVIALGFEIPKIGTNILSRINWFIPLLVIAGDKHAKRVFKRSKEEYHQTFGKARFADEEEVFKMGLTGSGIVFGKLGKKLVTKPPKVEGHTLIVGGPGSGKTRGVVIPTLLKWEGSVLAIDVKGELTEKTGDRRKQFGNVFVFNPEGNGDCYDPVRLCNSLDQAQDLARVLIPPPDNGEPFFALAAQSLLSAFVFEGAVYGYKLSDIAEKLCTTPVAELINHCRTHSIREVRLLASVSYDTHERTMSSVMAELKTRLITIATDSTIANATRKSDWSPETLEDGATVYLSLSEHLIVQYKDLWTVIINQILKHLSKRGDGKQPPILIALDEMARLSKINGLLDALATLRSRNVHIMAVVQSMAQLDSIYGNNERKIIADNCRFKFVLSASDPETQKYFSDLAGQRTALAKGVTTGAGLIPNSSLSEQGTPLIRPEDWAHLEKPILLAQKLQPLALDFAFWDKENF